MTARIQCLFVVSLLAPIAARCQLVDEFQPARANCCLVNTAQSLADQLKDWNQLGRYHADNQKLKAQPPEAGRVVFLGDSITDGWRLAEYFPGKPYVNRGISGQTTSQMLVRMFPDVIALKPAAVIILAGTNDVARNTGAVTAEMIQDNLQAITELAQAHGIKVILSSILPISDYTRTQTGQRPPADILRLNVWLKEYTARANATYLDYFSALVDDKGMLQREISNDGLHPSAKGYQIMAPLAAAAIEKALR